MVRRSSNDRLPIYGNTLYSKQGLGAAPSGNNMNMVEACALLQLESTASLDEIRSRFRTLASRFHPDRFFTPGERAVATRRFQDIAEAYAVLREFHREVAKTVPTSPVADISKSGAYAAANEGDRISSWDLLEPLRRIWVFDLVLEVLIQPSALTGALIALPFLLFGSFWQARPLTAPLALLQLGLTTAPV